LNAGSDAAIPTLRIRPLSLLFLLVFSGCGDDPAGPDQACGEEPSLPLGETIVRRLEPTDPVLDGSRIDYYGVRPDGSGTLSVEMSSGSVDPFLYLWADGVADPLAQGFDPTGGGPVRTAHLTFGVTAGCYRIGASAWPSADVGEYTIRADLMP
jgi:hypothetical protein